MRVLSDNLETGIRSHGEKGRSGNRGNRGCDGPRSGEAAVLSARWVDVRKTHANSTVPGNLPLSSACLLYTSEMLHEILWQQNVRLGEVCLHHPFVRGLADGTLDPEAFRRYVAQDAFFLNAFARAYALAAARSQDGETLISLCELLNGVLRELQLHAGYAKELKIELTRVQPYRAVAAYTDFLLAIAWQRGPGETIAAMTPCMRLYGYLGTELAKTMGAGNPCLLYTSKALSP